MELAGYSCVHVYIRKEVWMLIQCYRELHEVIIVILHGRQSGGSEASCAEGNHGNSDDRLEGLKENNYEVLL